MKLKILHKFKSCRNNIIYMFAKMSDDTYTKSWSINNHFEYTYISEEEYIAELANHILHNKDMNNIK